MQREGQKDGEGEGETVRGNRKVLIIEEGVGNREGEGKCAGMHG